MSFILEALKKSEAQRNRKTPGADQPLRIHRRPQSRRPFWPILLLVPLVAVSLALVWWMDRDSEPTRLAESTVVQERPDQISGEDVAGQTAGAPVNASVEPVPVPARDLESAALGSALSAASPPVERVDAVESPPATVPIPIRHENKIDTVALAAQQPADLRQTVPTSARIPKYADLTADLQRRLTRPEISLHVYSAVPERRMVRVDGQLMRQGERLPNGLQVYEIEPEQTVFRYSGQLFRLTRTAK